MTKSKRKEQKTDRQIPIQSNDKSRSLTQGHTQSRKRNKTEQLIQIVDNYEQDCLTMSKYLRKSLFLSFVVQFKVLSENWEQLNESIAENKRTMEIKH